MAKLRDYCNPDELVLGCVLDWMQEETIDFLGAPFEVEWQLAKMEKDGRVDAVLTTNGDAIILQCESVYFDFDPSKKEWREYKKADILSGSYPLSAYQPWDWPIVANLLGSDYNARIKNMGFKKIFNDILVGCPDLNLKTIKDHIMVKFPRLAQNMSTNYFETFAKSVAIYHHAPVLDINNNLVPLHDLPQSISRPWGTLIRIGNDSPAEVLPSAVRSYADAAQFLGPTFISGKPIEPFPMPKYTADDNPDVDMTTELPLFGCIDFNKIPISCVHSLLLQSYDLVFFIKGILYCCSLLPCYWCRFFVVTGSKVSKCGR